MKVTTLDCVAYVPTAEDVIVQKLRWARDKDVIEAADVLAVRGAGSLDMDYVRNWCRLHGGEVRLDEIVAKMPKI